MQRILGIDPGTRFCGGALLVDGALDWHQTLVASPALPTGEDEILHWYRRWRGIVRCTQPTVIVIEDYTWQGSERTSANAALMWQQVGALRCLGALPPSPQIALLAPSAWRQQLVGRGLPKKGSTEIDAAVAWVLTQRLGAACDPRSKGDGHWVDAAGIALAWWDTQHLLACEQPGAAPPQSRLLDTASQK